MNFQKDEVYVGNCLDLLKQMEDNAVDVTFTSPPYNRKRNDKYQEYDDTLPDFYTMLVEFTNECLRVTKRDVIVNIQWTYFNKVDVNRYIGHFAEALKGISIWVKTNPQPSPPQNNKGGYSVTNAFEFFFFFSRDNDRFKANNFNVHNVVTANINTEHFDGHSAVMSKPVAEKYILDYTKEDEIILDPFFGMGTTGLVAAENNRHYIGMEISPVYAKQAQERIEKELSQVRWF